MGTPTPPPGTGPGASSSWGRLPHASGAGVATRRAIGTDIRLVVADATALGVAEAVVDTVIDRVDELASRFRADSELSRLNALAIGGGTFLLSPEPREHLAAALAGARWSGGLLDPTIGDALVGAGYDRDLDEVPPDDARPARAGLVPGWRAVELRGALLEVGPGTPLDLGATAKALATGRRGAAPPDRPGDRRPGDGPVPDRDGRRPDVPRGQHRLDRRPRGRRRSHPAARAERPSGAPCRRDRPRPPARRAAGRRRCGAADRRRAPARPRAPAGPGGWWS
jgi:hypothetical protein